jgi:uncharacterized protein (DUF4415 family)
MEKKERIVRVTDEEARVMIARGEDQTDWAKVDAMSQAEVERLADEEDGPLPEGWEATVEIGIPVRKQALQIRLDADIVDWFKAPGPGYQTRINAVLRAFVRARQFADQSQKAK